MRELGVRRGVWSGAIVAWSVAGAALLSAGSLGAQEVDRAAVRRAQARIAADLAHEDARIVAAAARAAQREPARELVPALVGALRRWRVARGEHADLVCLFVLDALLANRARVDAADLEGLWHGAAGEVALALVCREPRANEAVLRRLWDEVYWPAQVRLAERGGFEAQVDPRCVLVGGLLAAQRAPGFAALLWREADLRLRVVVEDGGARLVSIALPESSRAEEMDREGFPPVPRFDWKMPHRVGSVFGGRLSNEGERFGAAGLEVVLVRREGEGGAAESELVMATGAMLGRKTQLVARELLQRMAGDGGDGAGREGGGLVALTECRPFLLTADAYRQQVNAAQERLRVALAALRERLVRAGALTGEEVAACAVDVEIVVEDRRQGRVVPLPEIEEGR